MTTVNILLVDDLRDFREEVLNAAFNPGTSDEPIEVYLRICRTSQSAVETLAKDERVWDQVWLDHDLGQVQGEDDTTMNVVDYILFRNENGDPLPVHNYIIHSSNPVGVKNIAMALDSIGRDSVIVNPRDFFTVRDSEDTSREDMHIPAL